MLKLLKYLKKSIIPLIFAFIFLGLQAYFDLSLPGYTSNIVNVGIQQNGIENACLEVIRESQFNNIMLFINDVDKNILLNNYELVEKNDIKYISKYPVLEYENIYILKNNKNNNEISKILEKPLLMISILSTNSEETLEIKKSITEKLGLKENDNILESIKNLPLEQQQLFINELYNNLNNMPESIITQSAIYMVRNEYKSIGININDIQTNYILKTGGIMLGIALISMILTILVSFISSIVGSKLGRDLRSSVFNKVMSYSTTEFKKFSTASLITRSTNDITQIQMLVVMGLRMVVYAPIMAIGGIIKVLNTNNSMSWIIIIAVMSVLTFVITHFMIVTPKFKIIQKLIDKLNLVMREILTGIPVIRAFSREKHEEKRFDNANKDLMKTNLFINRMMGLMMPIMMLIMNIISIVIVWVGTKNIDNGLMQVGDMMAFIQYTMEIMMSFFMISMVSIVLPRALVSASRIDEILTCDVAIKDPIKSKKFINGKQGLVEFKDVCFRYPDADYDVITDISFTANPGETTALIGSTGSGKSTVINLIPRFFDVSSGSILVNGVDIREVNQKDLRNKIGYVPQKGILFSGTIESNIKFGNKKASKDEVDKAITIAQAKEFISNINEGLNFQIAQGGTNVSGGQKQRLSIARAIAVDPDIYIFDDSFSALDYKTDSILRKELKKITKHKTVLIVAQRISTIMYAEKIIVMDEGKIVGIGKHNELLKTCDVYKQIASSQLSKEELENV